MSSSFDSYRQDLERGLKTITLAIDRSKRTNTLDEECDALLRRCKTNLQNLRQFSMPSTSPEAFAVNKLTAELARVENEWKQVQKSHLLSRAKENTNLTTPLLPTQVENDRNRVLRSNIVLDESSVLIRDISRTLGESNQIGSVTLHELEEQGRELEDVREDLRESKSAAKQAAQSLKRMASRALYNRIFLYAVIALLTVLDLTILWYRIKK